MTLRRPYDMTEAVKARQHLRFVKSNLSDAIGNVLGYEHAHRPLGTSLSFHVQVQVVEKVVVVEDTVLCPHLDTRSRRARVNRSLLEAISIPGGRCQYFGRPSSLNPA